MRAAHKNTSSPSYHRWERRGSVKRNKPNPRTLAAAVTVLMIASQMEVKRK